MKKNSSSGLDQAELKRYPGYLLARARFGAFRNFEEHIGRPFELRPVEFSVLLLVQSNEDVSQSQLALAMGVAAPNMTTILRRLEARELLARAPSPRDGRIQHIVLTAKGRKLLRDARSAGATMDRDWLGRLSAAEQAMLFELLNKLVGEPGSASG